MNIYKLVYGDYAFGKMNKEQLASARVIIEEIYNNEPEWGDVKPTPVQVAQHVCDFYGIPREILMTGGQLRYFAIIRKAIAFLIVKIYDPASLEVLKHGFYHKKLAKGLRVQIGYVTNREGSTVSHIVRGAVREYDSDKNIKLLFNYFNRQLFRKYGNTEKIDQETVTAKVDESKKDSADPRGGDLGTEDSSPTTKGAEASPVQPKKNVSPPKTGNKGQPGGKRNGLATGNKPVPGKGKRNSGGKPKGTHSSGTGVGGSTNNRGTRSTGTGKKAQPKTKQKPS